MSDDLAVLIGEERLCEVPGFGDAIVKKITEWAKTGIKFIEEHHGEYLLVEALTSAINIRDAGQSLSDYAGTARPDEYCWNVLAMKLI